MLGRGSDLDWNYQHLPKGQAYPKTTAYLFKNLFSFDFVNLTDTL